MRLNDLPDHSKLELRFMFKGKNYSMEVAVQMNLINTIFIQAISCNGAPIDNMEVNDPVLIYKTEKGLYLFKDAEYKLVHIKGANLYAVTCQKEADKINRRSAYRVYINEPIKLKLTKLNENKIELSGILKDLSLTGMGIILPYKGDDIKTMEIQLELGRNTDINLIGRIVRIKELANNKGYLYGCSFQTQKEALSRYIISRQMRNKIHE